MPSVALEVARGKVSSNLEFSHLLRPPLIFSISMVFLSQTFQLSSVTSCFHGAHRSYRTDD